MPRDYGKAKTAELASWRRQFRKSVGIKCEFGHADCGCSTARSMDGKAPCYAKTLEEQDRRERADALKTADKAGLIS